MSKITVVFGGNVGSDPRSPRTWSGSGAFMVDAMKQADMLDRAVGVELPQLRKAFFLGKNFNRRRPVWRTHYYFDPGYRRALSRAAARIDMGASSLLQIGHMFSLRDAFPQRRCMSYHDGNLAVRLSSGFGFEGVSRIRIDQALRFEEQTAAQMDAIFTMSEYVRNSFISDYHARPERVFNVGAGINLTSFPEPNPDKDYSAPRILFVGIEFIRKGGPQLLQAFRAVREKLPSAELHIAGPAALPNLPNGVVFHGHLSKSDPSQRQQLEKLYRKCSLFVLPSLYEPFGIAPLEAMLYQLPCLVTDAFALRETVKPEFNGELVPRSSVEALQNAMIRLLSDPERLASMGRRGRELVLSRFTWPTVIERMRTAQASLAAP